MSGKTAMSRRWSDIPQQRAERVHRQMAGMSRGLRQTSNFADQLFPADPPRFVHSFPPSQFGDRRATSHRRNAAFRTKANVGDALAPVFKAKRKLKNVAADRILQARNAIGRVNFTRVARMLEMV
jgi:hypothetical protein